MTKQDVLSRSKTVITLALESLLIVSIIFGLVVGGVAMNLEKRISEQVEACVIEKQKPIEVELRHISETLMEVRSDVKQLRDDVATLRAKVK